jgi:GNAT superfamily N-acetyltransferase
VPDQVASFFISPVEVGAWVAEAEGSIVGHVALHWWETDPTLYAVQRETGVSGGDLVKVSRLFVAPAHRRSGTGRLLLRHAEQQARERNQRAVLDVGQTLHAAVALYESEGWSRIADLHLPLDEEWRRSADQDAIVDGPLTIDLWVYASPG